MDYQYVLDRLDSIHSELITLSLEAGYGARGRLAVRHIVAALTEVHIARVHVAGQQKAEELKIKDNALSDEFGQLVELALG